MIILVCYMIIQNNASYTSDDDESLENTDPLNKNVFSMNINGTEHKFSWWPITHFVLFLFVGLLFDTSWYLPWMVGGAYWEGLEFTMGSILSKWVLKPPETKKNTTTGNNTQYERQWLNGGYSDLAFNGAGLLLGYLIKLTFEKKSTLQEGSNGDTQVGSSLEDISSQLDNLTPSLISVDK